MPVILSDEADGVGLAEAWFEDGPAFANPPGATGGNEAPSSIAIGEAGPADGVLDEAVWKFHIGGYQVCEKWLKDRKGRTLTKDEITHYCKIVVALAETIQIMKEIDMLIDQHGGWPLAGSVKA